MSISEERLQVYHKESQNREEGVLNGIPLFYTFPKLATILPAIPNGYPILWTANSGVGKTQSWIGIFVYTVYKLKKEHPELNIKIKLVIVLLEDTKEMFIDRLYCMLLFNLYQIVLEPMALHSQKETPLSKDILEKLTLVKVEVDNILEDCEIADSIYNSTGIYKWARTISNKLGKHHQKEVMFSDSDGNQTPTKVYSHYEQNDKNTHVLMVVDNLNNLAVEMKDGRLLTERETINLWTRTYCRLQITKHWHWSVINIIQQAADTESQQFTMKGVSIVEKLKPSLSGLGNSKECQRDHFLIFGLFAPARYGIGKYPDSGYDINKLEDKFRSLIILKSNISKSNIEIPMYFNGACSLVREMPSLNETEKLNYLYKNLV